MKPVLIMIGLLAIAAVGWFWPQPVKLDAFQYDLAMALYRVCNQHSDEGLAKVETLIADAAAAEPNREPSPLLPIIATARTGNWNEACQACRDMLEDQVDR